ncbi:MAG: hypothetical protein LUD76_08135, partial [Alistipes sp.]|nr:hypothetical protein [Alistipes sp.]
RLSPKKPPRARGGGWGGGGGGPALPAGGTPDAGNESDLDNLGIYGYRRGGEKHAWSPEAIKTL